MTGPIPDLEPTLDLARAAATDASRRIASVSPDTVAFTSRGTVLVTGPAVRALAVLTELQAPLRVVAFIPDAGSAKAARDNARLVTAPITSLTGYLGQFTAFTVPVDGMPVDAGRFGWNEDRRFDFVVDLNEPPLLSRQITPPGYFAPPDAAAVLVAFERIRNHPASLRKPTYFAYDPARCTHGASGVRGCTRCLDACPAGAITSAGEKVRFDPYLCQGCATCTAVCPDGAVRYADPSPNVLLERLQVMLVAWRATTGQPARLIVHSAQRNAGVDQAKIQDALPFPVHAVAAFGIEAWFAALAWGAGQVVLDVPDDTPEGTRVALRHEVATAQAILSGIDQERASVCLLEPGIFNTPAQLGTPLAPADHLPADSKRATLFAAIDWLAKDNAHRAGCVDLPKGASLGAIRVDQTRCTLCLACTNLCPTSALTSGSNVLHELRFTESRCVQCGLCEAGCPEDAITRLPQFTVSRAQREASAVLMVDEPFLCTTCGTPFISKRTLQRSMELVKDHPLIQQEGIERLKLCMSCRAEATMRNSDRAGN